MSALPIDRKGLAITAGTFLIWGVVPLYWHLLKAVPSFQIIAHRIVWSAVLVIGWLLLKNGRTWWRRVRAQPRAVPLLGVSSLLIAFNWGLYIWAVNAGQVVETSLGYFINPLLSVLMGVFFLRARLRAWQWVACGVAAAGVLYLTVAYGSLPWIALTLAGTFGVYGLVKKLAPLGP